MNIYKKLMLSLVGLTSIILIATLLLARWSFEQGFNNYLHGQEMERLSRISEEIMQIAPKVSLVSEIEKRYLDRIIEHHTIVKDFPRGRRPREKEFGPRPPPPHLLDSSEKRLYTGVYDVNGEHVAGDYLDENRTDKFIMFELMIENNQQTIGVLKSWRSGKFDSIIANEFSKQQISTSVLIGAFSLALAVVLSYFGAKTLLAPIKLIINGVEDLSNGNYTRALSNKREDEFGDLINNVNRLAEILEQTRSAKNRWFADISHELRTPLTVLMGELEALKLGIRPLSMAQIDSLTQEAALLKRLIDDLYQLSLSDIGALRYEFAEVNVSALLIRLLAQKTTAADEASVMLEHHIDADVKYNGDENRLNQLFANLVNNSIAYTDRNGLIKVSLCVHNNQIKITIEDSAPGLSEAECEQIFEPLYRHNKARTRNSGGAGLGLAICKNIVEAHGGEIVAKPSKLKGVELVVTFPVSPIRNKKVEK